MKPMKLTSLMVMLLVGFSAAAQEEFFDDVYFSSSKKDKKEKIEIKPNQQAEWSRENVKLQVREVDPDLFVAWKNGHFIFRQDRLENIMKTLARWYDMEVVYLDESIKNMAFAGKLDRSEDITPILNVLRATDKLTVEVNGKRIVLGVK